ncbi:MAG: tRNA pseudouridine(54/55) synthase Pus10 [Candidatus Thermoplasmatota archaeon]|nr:tRNA pseudouridine(54/55) synthase Pus10 [Candidatus Thermoplasmatota archaeon]
MPSYVSTAKTALDRGLCLRCTGRMFAKVGSGLSNQQRGLIIKKMLGEGVEEGDFETAFLQEAENPPEEQGEEKDCNLCGGLFSHMEEMVEIVTSAMGDWEFDTFLLGSRPDPEMVEAEENFWKEAGAESQEPIKMELNREVGKRASHKMGKEVEFKHPDMVAVYDVLYGHVDLESNPVHFYGRYRKLERGIPQTRWPCRNCGGGGCKRCGETGKMYSTSVEELVCATLMEMLQGDEHSFHGMGREDIDARMLGSGRPFVAEIKHPRKRKIDVGEAMERINKLAENRVEISGLRYSDKAEVRRVKDAAPDKSYSVRVEFCRDIEDTELEKTLELQGKELSQRTPNRVSHRRADIVRKRTIFSIDYSRLDAKTVDFAIKAASGTYIKEFCHGDENRTEPSIAGWIGIPCRVLHLDVLGIHDSEE